MLFLLNNPAHVILDLLRKYLYWTYIVKPMPSGYPDGGREGVKPPPV
jgi:hypothetical protein